MYKSLVQFTPAAPSEASTLCTQFDNRDCEVPDAAHPVRGAVDVIAALDEAHVEKGVVRSSGSGLLLTRLPIPVGRWNDGGSRRKHPGTSADQMHRPAL